MGIEQADLSELKPEGWRSTVVPFCHKLFRRQTEQLSDTTVDFLLDGMSATQVGVERPTHLLGRD